MELPEVIDRADRAVGDRLEGAVAAHHRRRLRRAGWEPALDVAPSFTTPLARAPEGGHEIEILVDGDDALRAMVDTMRAARVRVCLAGWFFSAGFALERGASPVILEDLLAELAGRVEVYVLAWAGAPLPLFRPGRRDVAAELARLSATGAHVAADRHERPMHCHHEKLVIVDDAIAFVGGVDLTDLAGDRLDVRGHPRRGSLGWHDAASRVTGPVVQQVVAHFALRWHAVTGERLESVATAPPASRGPLQAQLVRTVPEHIYHDLPDGEFTILAAYLGALRAADRLIYLENQFLWSSEVVAILRDKLRDPPCDEFRIVLVLPSRPNNGADDTRGQLGVLVEADGGANRFLACTLCSPGPVVERVYVHAKIGIVDDRWLTIGSANLNEHSLFNDTEMNLVVLDERLATSTRQRLFSEHLDLPESDVAGDACRVIDELWRPRAREQRARVDAGGAPTGRLVELPHVSRRSKRLFGPIQSLLVDG